MFRDWLMFHFLGVRVFVYGDFLKYTVLHFNVF